MDNITQAKNHLEQADFYYEESGDFEKALEECDAAIELDPDLAEAHNLRGILLEGLNRPIEALRAYQQAAKIDQNLVDAKENFSELKSELTTSNGLVTIAKFKFPTEGTIVRSKLEAKNIWSFVSAIDNVAITSGGNLQVREDDVEKALDVLNQEVDFSNWSDEDFYIGEEFAVEDTTSEVHQGTDGFEIAGFWRRFLGFVIDGFILGIPLIIIGFAFRDLAFSLGPWGRLVGYGIIFLYWSYFNSALGNGQTIGKKLMKTVVVDSNGTYLPLSKSMLRAGVLASIGLLNQWALPILQNPIIALVVVTIIFGGGLALLYGLIFNRKTRQGIHDLIAGSYVVNALPGPETMAPAIPRIHKRITLGLVGVGLILGLASFFMQETNPTLGILEPEEWQEIQVLQSVLSENDEFFSVGVQRLNRHQIGNETVMKDLDIDVWVKKSCGRNPEYCDELLKEVAQTAFENYDDIDNLTGMRVTLSNRFDLGLASGNFNRSTAGTIEDWRKQLE